VADGAGDDGLDLVALVAEPFEGGGYRLVDDLEETAAGELLELDQGEVGLDAGGVAVHDQADGPGRREHGGLGVAIAVGRAQVEGAVPGVARCREQLGRCGLGVEPLRSDGETLVHLLGCVVGRPSVVAHDPQHVLPIRREAGARAELTGHDRRAGIGLTGHDGGDGAADGAAIGRVVRDAETHEQRADVGEAEAEGAVGVAELGDLTARKRCHQDRDLEDDGPQPHRVAEGVDVESALVVEEDDEVEGRQVAGRVVEKHVLRARVRGVDAPARGACVPLVDRVVVL